MTEESRFRRIFTRLHESHAGCIGDEWLGEPCRDARGRPLDRPIAWSRRNGPWRRVDVLWVGAAPGNAGGRGSGASGAHGTRIPFGGDIAGANLDVLLGSIGLSRNETFIVASLNHLPTRGGGEPTMAEVLAPAGDFTDSIDVLRATIVAAGPRLIIALGNVAARVTAAAWSRAQGERVPGLASLQKKGWSRNVCVSMRSMRAPDDDVERDWMAAWRTPPDPDALWLAHPSAQNMSPYAGTETAFHRRMLEARDVLGRVVRTRLGWTLPRVRPHPPVDGIYALPEWREIVAERHAELDRLWREKGV